MEKDNLQQKIMEMDEKIELLVGSNQVIADTNLRTVRHPSNIPTIQHLLFGSDYQILFFYRAIPGVLPAAVSSAGG